MSNVISGEDRFVLSANLVGEQVAELPSDFVLSSDVSFNENINNDTREEKFIYAYTDSGVSANKRDWSPDIMRSIGEQVVSKMPPGYLGHIKPADYGFDFPEPQVVWFGSSITELAGEQVRLWLKGYLLPTAQKLTTWIKSKAVNSISVYGNVSYSKDSNGVDKILNIDLKSIDISRKLAEGLSSGISGLAVEMSDNNLEGDVCEMSESKTFTIADVKNDSNIMNQLRQEFAAEMQLDAETNQLKATAAEMSQLCSVLDVKQSQVLDSVKSMVALVTGIKTLFAGEQENIDVQKAAEDFLKEKAAVDEQLKKIIEIVQPVEGQSITDAVTDIIDKRRRYLAKEAVAAVGTTFDDLAKGLNNEVLKEYVRDDFSKYLNEDVQNITDSEAWQKDTIAYIKDNFQSSVDKHQKRLEKLAGLSKAAGEMSAVVNLGGTNNSAPKGEMSAVDEEIALAKQLGYGEE